jgi:hypothetical protein
MNVSEYVQALHEITAEFNDTIDKARAVYADRHASALREFLGERFEETVPEAAAKRVSRDI